MANHYRIKTMLLRQIFVFFSFFGVQLYRPNDALDWLKVCYKICFNLTIFYILCFMDPLRLGMAVSRCHSYKPLFFYFIYFGCNYAYPFAFVVEMTYYWLVGDRIVRRLDSRCFRRYYRFDGREREMSRFLIAMFVTSNGIVFFVYMFDKLQIHSLHRWPSVIEIFGYATVYIVSSYDYSTLQMLHYYQQPTCQILQRIERRLKMTLPLDESRRISHVVAVNETRHVADDAYREIRELAMQNDALHQLISLPWIVHLMLNMFTSISIIGMAILCEPDIALLIQVLCLGAYATYLMRMNACIVQTFDRIVALLRRVPLNAQMINISNNSNSIRTIEIFAKNRNTNYNGNGDDGNRKSTFTRLPHSESEFSIRMRYDQFEIYRKYFRIQIFSFVKVDLPFMFQIIVFIISYVVFFTQTN